MAENFVKDPRDVVGIDETVEVRVKQIDDLGRINLSMILDVSKERNRVERQTQGRFSKEGDYDRSRGRGRFRPRSDSGPHFPSSRYIKDRKDFNR